MKAELLILGVLHRGDFHPYEIRRRLRNAMVECYTDVDVGTLYYAVRQLAKQGRIAAVAQQTVARGGTRTVYRITPAGRRRFHQLLQEQFDAPGSVAATLYPALLFLHLADRPTVALSLEARVARATAGLSELQAVRQLMAARLGTGGDYLMRHVELQRRLDRKWLKSLLATVKADKVRDLANPKVLRASKP
jgi:DNA-binding PadR family transcriptional regulator